MPQATRILLSLLAGLVLGIAGARAAPGATAAAAGIARPIGTAWLHGLQMTIVPLVVSLLVTGIGATAQAARAGRITARAVALIVATLWTTTLVAAVLEPLILRLFPLPPALGRSLRAALGHAAPVGRVPGIAAFFDTAVPANVVAAAAADGFLPLTVFALAFAFAVSRLPAERRGAIVPFFQATVDALLVLIGWVLRLAPLGVGALAFGVGAATGAAAFGALAHYIACVSAVGLVVILLGYPAGAIGGRVRLARFARAALPAQAVAVSTQSSLACLPAMIEGAAALDAPRETSGIVLPLAVSIFRATSPAMNLSVALYIAHWLQVPLGPAQYAAGIATAAITTMSSVSLPGTISYVASVAPVALAMGVPIEPLGILIAVETIPDLFRTVGNVTMDVALAATVAARTPAAPGAPAITQGDGKSARGG